MQEIHGASRNGGESHTLVILRVMHNVSEAAKSPPRMVVARPPCLSCEFANMFLISTNNTPVWDINW